MSSLSCLTNLLDSGDYSDTLSLFLYVKCFLPTYPYYNYFVGNISLCGGLIIGLEYARCL